MPHNIVGAILETAEALGAIGRKQFLNEVTRMGIEVTRELDTPVQDLLVDAERVL